MLPIEMGAAQMKRKGESKYGVVHLSIIDEEDGAVCGLSCLTTAVRPHERCVVLLNSLGRTTLSRVAIEALDEWRPWSLFGPRYCWAGFFLLRSRSCSSV